MRERHIFDIKSFSGVDFSSPLLSVDNSRAIDALNLLKKENDRTQKRKPWEQVAFAPDFTYHKKQDINNNPYWDSYKNTTSFNGIWAFVAEDGKEHIVAHIGKCLFEVSGLSKNGTFKDVVYRPLCIDVEEDELVYHQIVELVDEKTKGVTSGNRLYIMGGTKYLMVRFYTEENKTKFDICAVEDSKYVYIPVTSTGITYTDSPNPGRQLLDDVNLLSSLRKNKLLSGTLYKGNNVIRTTRFFEYELDSDIDFGNIKEDSFEIRLEYRKVVE